MVNPDNGKYAFLSYGPKSGEMIADNGKFNYKVDFRNSSSLTIQTNPEDSDALINAIEAINRGEPPNFSAYSNNCTTEVQDVLKDFGLSFGDRLPSTYWSDIYHKYSMVTQEMWE